MNFHIREYSTKKKKLLAFGTLHKKRPSTRLAFHRIHLIPARVVLCFAKKRFIETKVSARKKDRIVVITKKGVLLTHSRKTGYLLGDILSKEEKKKFTTWGRIRRIKPPPARTKTTTNVNHPPLHRRLTPARQGANDFITRSNSIRAATCNERAKSTNG